MNITNFDETKDFFGKINKEIYGINPYAKGSLPNEFNNDKENNEDLEKEVDEKGNPLNVGMEPDGIPIK